jgi:DNA-binding MarR family transcriptional regulator
MQSDAKAIRKMFEEESLGAPENAVGFVLWRISARYQREVDRSLALNNLTSLQFITLALVAWFGREDLPVTQIELARSAGIHPMQVSQTLKALEAKKMVSRWTSKLDTRAKRVEVTSSGLQTLQEALPKVIEVQSRLFGKAGLPGGTLLKQLQRVDGRLLNETGGRGERS